MGRWGKYVGKEDCIQLRGKLLSRISGGQKQEKQDGGLKKQKNWRESAEGGGRLL